LQKVIYAVIICCSFLIQTNLFAQTYKLSGKVSDVASQGLSYVSIKVKSLQSGTTSNQDGNYSLHLEKGNYEMIFSIIGYKTQTVLVSVDSNKVLDVSMEEEIKAISEVQITVTKKDRAEEIIENVIRQKEKTENAAKTFSCNVYIRATEENNAPTKTIKILSRPIKNKSDSLKLNMAEVLLKLDHSSEKIKEERIGVKLRGNTTGLFFLTTTDGDFNFYKNLVKVPALTAIPMLSPISFSGLVAYKFKTLNIRKENGRKIYTIKIIPSKSGNAQVEGEVDVMDSAWVILRTHFEFPKYQLLDYDYFSVDQQYQLANNKAWMPASQEFNYLSKVRKTSGKSTAVYYDYVIDTSFSKNHFSAQVSSAASDAYNKDENFWEDVRKEPLTEVESKFVELSDREYRRTHTKPYLDSLDKDFNKITFSKVVFYGQGIFNRDKERTIILPPLINVVKPFQLGGVRIGIDGSYNKVFASKKILTVLTDLSYGIRNQDIKGNVKVRYLFNPINASYYSVYAGREFAYIYNNDSWVSAFKRSNIYEKDEVGIESGVELANGLYVSDKIEFAARNSVQNYKFNTKFDTLFRGALTNNTPIAFDPYNAVYNDVVLTYVPHQLYIREPKEKIILGSKWPTFMVTWRKGVPSILNSKIDFDYLELNISQRLKLGLVGVSEYSFITGSFLNTNKVGFVDYKYMRRGDPLLFTEPSRNFQALDSTFPVFNQFFEGHYIHNFNGALINKIAPFKSFKINEVLGGGFLFLGEKNLQYFEAFAGLEKILNIFREKIKIGVYAVGSVANKFNNPLQFKIGVQYFNRTKKIWL
jgi:hypothetical protein